MPESSVCCRATKRLKNARRISRRSIRGSGTMFDTLRARLKGWKTIVVNAVLGLPAALYTIYVAFGAVDFTPVIPAKYVALFALGWSVLGITLRLITTGPVGSKGN